MADFQGQGVSARQPEPLEGDRCDPNILLDNVVLPYKCP